MRALVVLCGHFFSLFGAYRPLQAALNPKIRLATCLVINSHQMDFGQVGRTIQISVCCGAYQSPN